MGQVEETMDSRKIQTGQEIQIAGQTFRAMNIMDYGIYFARVLKSGKLASINAGNHGTYTYEELDRYILIGAIS